VDADADVGEMSASLDGVEGDVMSLYYRQGMSISMLPRYDVNVGGVLRDTNETGKAIE